MPLTYTPVKIPFGLGQDESTHPYVLPPPKLKSLINGRISKAGAVYKRHGWARLANDAQTVRTFCANGKIYTRRCRTANEQPQAIGALNGDQTRIDVVGGPGGGQSISEVEVLGRHGIMRDIAQNAGGVTTGGTYPDFCFDPTSGLEVIAWEQWKEGVPRIMAVVIDRITRTQVSPPREVSTGPAAADQCLRPRVVRQAQKLYVVYAHVAGTAIRAVPYDCTTRTWGTDTQIVADANASATFDACNYEETESAGWWLAYHNTVPSLTYRAVNDLTPAVASTIAEVPAAITVRVNGTDQQLWLAWYVTGGDLRCRAFSTFSGAGLFAATSVETPGDPVVQLAWARQSITVSVLVWSVFTATTAELGVPNSYSRAISKYRYVNNAGTMGTKCSRTGIEMVSKPTFSSTGICYGNFLYDAGTSGGGTAGTTYQARKNSAGFSTCFTLAIVDSANMFNGPNRYSWRPVATWAIGVAGNTRRGGTGSQGNSLSSFYLVDADTEMHFVLATNAEPTATASLGVFGKKGVDLCRLSLDRLCAPQVSHAEIGQNVVFSGGTPTIWDGDSLTEYGFLAPPENCIGSYAATGTDLLTAGTIAARCIWQYRHATGDVVRSAAVDLSDVNPVATSYVVAALSRLNCYVPALGLTKKYSDSSTTNAQRSAGVSARLYRTDANGSIYYYEGEDSAKPGMTQNDPFLLTPLPFSGSWVIQQSDASIQTNEILYTTDGILQNYPLPALAHIINHRGRLMGISAEDRRTIVYTHIYEPGELPGWNPLLQFQVPSEAVALASLDEKLIIFCTDSIYVVTGVGPDRKGLNSDYSEPALLNGHYGCKGHRSIVSMPNGLMFQSGVGICLLDRSLNVSYVGGPVMDTLAAAPYVYDAVAYDIDECVYWACGNTASPTDSTTSPTIVYDWRMDQWSVDNMRIELEGGTGAGVITSFAYDGSNLYATFRGSTGLYHYSGYADPHYNSTSALYVSTSITTAQIFPAQLQGWQRFRWVALLGQKMGGHQLTMSLITDYGTTEAIAWSQAEIDALSYEHLKMHVANQKATSLQVQITDLEGTSGATQGPIWLGLALDVGIKAGIAKVPTAGVK